MGLKNPRSLPGSRRELWAVERQRAERKAEGEMALDSRFHHGCVKAARKAEAEAKPVKEAEEGKGLEEEWVAWDLLV